MPWKFIFTILILIVIIIFAGFNVHPVKISFGLLEFSNVPMFVSLLSSFALGTIISVPFVMISRKKKIIKKKEKKGAIEGPKPPTLINEENQIVINEDKEKVSD